MFIRASQPAQYRKAMLDKLTKVVSIATIVALYLTALFNVGYFAFIGYHFIGVVDVSNIVYTFGLVLLFIAVFLLLGTIISLALGLFGLFAEVSPKLKTAAKPVSAVAVLMLLSYALFGLKEDEFLVFGAIFAPIGGVVLAWLAYSSSISGKIFEAAAAALSSFIVISLGILIMGLTIARYQIHGPVQRYDIFTNTTDFLNVRVLRSSSSGFLFYHDGRMVFLPSGEIKKVISTVDKSI